MRLFRCFKTKEEREAFAKKIGKQRVCFREPTSYSKNFYKANGVDIDVYKYALIYKMSIED